MRDSRSFSKTRAKEDELSVSAIIYRDKLQFRYSFPVNKPRHLGIRTEKYVLS